MQFKRPNAKVLFLICALIVVQLANSAPSAIMAPTKDQREYETGLQQIKELREGKDFAGLEKLAGQIEDDWQQWKIRHYASLILSACDSFRSSYFTDQKKYSVAQKHALLALEKPDLPIDLELRLLLQLRTDFNAEKGPDHGEQWAKDRRERAKLWLQGWQRLNDSLANIGGLNGLPLSNPPLPPGINGAGGMDPESIKDPIARKQYEAGLEQNRRSIERFNMQVNLRRIAKDFFPAAETYLISAYSRKPYRLDELTKDLQRYVADANARDRIVAAVRQATSGDESHPPPATPAPSPDQGLGVELRKIELLRDGSQTPFSAVEQQGKQLLLEYPAPPDQGQIYYCLAGLYAQSGMVHPDEVIEYALKALALPLPLPKKMRLYVYWGDALQVSNPQQPLLVKRKAAVEPYLRGLKELLSLSLPEQAPELPLVTALSIAPGQAGLQEKGREYELALAAREKVEVQAVMIKHRDVLTGQIVSLYCRRPFEIEELREMAGRILENPGAVDRLMSAVRDGINEQAPQVTIVPDKADVKQPLPESNKRWWLIVSNLVGISVILALLVIRHVRRIGRKGLTRL